MTTLETLKVQAIACTTQPRRASAVINGHIVEVRVAEGYRNGGRGKIAIRWSVDGKTVAAATLAKTFA